MKHKINILCIGICLLFCCCKEAPLKERPYAPVSTLYLNHLGPNELETMVQLAMNKRFGEASIGAIDEKWAWLKQEGSISYPYLQYIISNVLKKQGYEPLLMEEVPKRYLSLYTSYIESFDGRIEVGVGVLENSTYIRFRLLMATANESFKDRYNVDVQNVFREVEEMTNLVNQKERKIKSYE